MSFAPQQPPGPNRQERQSEMEAITLQQERDEEERIRLAEEEAKNKAEAERLLKEQQARTLAAQQAAEATAFSANTTSKPNEIEETVKIKTNPVTGEQTTTLEEKVPAGVPTSIGPVSPNMEGGAAPIPLTPTATTVKPITPDMEGGAAPVAMGAGTLTPTVGAPGSVPTLQDTLGAANEAGATVTPGSTPATSGVDGQAGTSEQSFLDKTIDFLKSREKSDVPLTKPTMPGITSAKLGGAESTAAGGATLRPGQMPGAQPVAPAVNPMQGGMQPVIQQPIAPQPAVGGQQMMPQGGGMLAPGADQPGPAIPQIGGMQPVSYQVPDNDAYAMAQQQNYPMDELGNYYAPNGQVISPGMTMSDLTSASTQTPVSPGAVSNMEGGAAPVAMGTGTQTPVAPGQVLDMEGGVAPIALSDSPEVELSKIVAVDSELPEVPKTQAELDALKAKNIADGGTEVGAIVEVDDSKDTIDAQIVKETDNALTNKNVDGLATLLVSDKVSPEKKDIIKENIKTITVNSIKEERAKRKADELFAKANAGDKNAPKQIANELKPSKSDDKGSYLKAYLFQRLGMTQAMNNEYKLLGLGTMQVSLTDSNGKFAGRATQAVDGRLVPGSAIGIDNKPISETQLASLTYLKSNNTRSPYAVTKASMVYMPGTGKKGDADYIEAAGYQIETGVGKTPKIFDSTGKQVTDPTLAKAILKQYAKKDSTSGASVAKDTYMDPTQVVKGNWAFETIPGGQSRYVRLGDGAIATREQADRLRKTGVKGTLGDQYARDVQALEISLIGKTEEQKFKILDKVNEIRARNGFQPISNEAINLNVPQIRSQNIVPGAVVPGAIDQEGGVGQGIDQADAEGTGSTNNVPPAGTGSTNNVPPAGTDLTGPTATEIVAIEDAKKAEAKIGPAVKQKEQEAYVTVTLPAVTKSGDEGASIANLRRQQMTMLDTNTDIIGILRNTGTQWNQTKALIRDTIAGKYSTGDTGEFADAVAKLTISPQQKSALREFYQLNTNINAQTLSKNAGTGTKTDADMKANKDANMSDIGDVQVYTALNEISRSAFDNDMATAKLAFANANRDTIKTNIGLSTAWNKAQQPYLKAYEGIYSARLDYINKQMENKFGTNWRKNKTNDETQEHWGNVSANSFRVYPVPEFNAETGKFTYGSKQSKIAAMKAIAGQ